MEKIHFEIKERENYARVTEEELRLMESGLMIRLKKPDFLADPEIIGIHIRLVLESEVHSLMLARNRVCIMEDCPWLKITFQHEAELMTMILQRLDMDKTFSNT